MIVCKTTKRLAFASFNETVDWNLSEGGVLIKKAKALKRTEGATRQKALSLGVSLDARV